MYLSFGLSEHISCRHEERFEKDEHLLIPIVWFGPRKPSLKELRISRELIKFSFPIFLFFSRISWIGIGISRIEQS
jgi:hypothetical protein